MYTPLPETFKKDGFEYHQVKRDGIAAIYAQISEGKTIAFEVYKITTQEAGERIMAGVPVKIEAKEVIPSTKMWGKTAWTCRDLSEAEAKMKVIQERAAERSLANEQA